MKVIYKIKSYKERISVKYTWLIYIVLYVVSIIIINKYTYLLIPKSEKPFVNYLYEIAYSLALFLFLAIGVLGVIMNANKTRQTILFEKTMEDIGLINAYGNPPILLKTEKVRRGTIFFLYSPLLSLQEYLRNIDVLNNALDIEVRQITYGKTNEHIVIKAVTEPVPEIIYWNDVYLSDKDFEIKVGEGDFDNTSIDLNFHPHVLIASSTGGGKTSLLNLIIHQCIKKGAQVRVVDFKGGMDYLKWKDQNVPVAISEDECLYFLQELLNIMEERKEILIKSKTSDISDFNKENETPMQRIIVIFDEVADVLGATKTKENKIKLEMIESAITRLVRLGRAFGIHMIMCFQRPSSKVLDGDIKANLGYRICGVGADKIMSEMVLDNPSASEIEVNSKGCFFDKEQGFFKAYYLEK